MAAILRRELGAEVTMTRARYGEFKILLDGETLIDGGMLGALGVLPSSRKILDVVRARLALKPDPGTAEPH